MNLTRTLIAIAGLTFLHCGGKVTGSEGTAPHGSVVGTWGTGAGVSATAVAVPAGYVLIPTDMHSHSTYSDGDDTPAQRWADQKASGLSAGFITDHDFQLGDAEWSDLATQAALWSDANFIAMRGQESAWHVPWSAHTNVFFGNATEYGTTSRDDLFDAIAADGDEDVCAFNHISASAATWVDRDDYYGSASSKYCLAELQISLSPRPMAEAIAQYISFLDKGWKVAPSANTDRHFTGYPAGYRTNIFAPAFSEAGILAAIKARCTCASTTRDSSWAFMHVGAHPMGSTIPAQGGTVTASVTISSHVRIATIEIYRDGVVVNTGANGDPLSNYSVSGIDGSPGYIFAVVTRTDGTSLVCAPVWLE